MKKNEEENNPYLYHDLNIKRLYAFIANTYLLLYPLLINVKKNFYQRYQEMCAIPANMLWGFLLCWDKLQTISQTCLQLPLHFILLPLLFPLGALEIQIPMKNICTTITFSFHQTCLLLSLTLCWLLTAALWKYKHPYTRQLGVGDGHR